MGNMDHEVNGYSVESSQVEFVMNGVNLLGEEATACSNEKKMPKEIVTRISITGK